ncbi:precorrin-3B C(17)-methyltransferase [Aphanothece hegewaldii CCALA 016]|uniref:Precorrin-3B C(17)-methyltransferase n=1 Tax=Aphanothece hegewaldii CCALA 016 TaxID=2107694 RepID=A0A2T1LRY4_9CHRO|nr:precorrin-3B C(17)-methyltransferase [Aphanothece hegewaldii]PSF32003.1 precorrin-3B C(17)-methyltransferase [Aphanothece hegewaldii CCALA 016]
MSQFLFQSCAAIALTPRAVQILFPLCQTGDVTLHIPSSLASEITPPQGSQIYESSLKDHLTAIWSQYRAFIFVAASGIVVRLIAPLLAHKTEDPAIIVIDPEGQYVISLCSGHQGGADQLTRLIAQQLTATPIITSASTSLNLPGIDILGVPFGWQKGQGDWNGISRICVHQEPIQVIQEAGSTLWQKSLPTEHPFYFGFNEEISFKGRIWITPTSRRFAPSSDIPKVQWHPRVLWVGIGCIRGATQEQITTAVQQVLQKSHLAFEAIAGLATIDIKADEIGLLNYAQSSQLPLKTYTAEILKTVTVPNPSHIVAQAVDTPSVAEAAALSAAKEYGEAVLLVQKQVTEAVTVAIAQAEIEYTGRTGYIGLVGIGPGNITQITPAAKTAITQADVIIGYSLYTDLIQPLQHPAQIIESLPITQEVQRARRAIELAQWGLSVVVISSGDCGIYGMAGLVLEQLSVMGWDGNTPQVEVFPGISALQAAASRVGAPLMHDFCAISLSDLLTPIEVIEKRLEAAAKADFVTAIYNPCSKTRIQPLLTAEKIFLMYRDPLTPVAIVRSVYRQDEEIILTTLGKMLWSHIDMLTTILIGNSTTFFHENWMITPRGYLKNE